jgi:hypothetical protein
MAPSSTGKGRPQTPETRAKIAATLKGRPHPHKGHEVSPETRVKISAAKKGRVFSSEHRAKLSAAHKGRTHRPGGK